MTDPCRSRAIGGMVGRQLRRRHDRAPRDCDRCRPGVPFNGGRIGDLTVDALAGAPVTLHAVVPVRPEAFMGKLIYAANTSLDGYLEDATGSFDWSVPDDEVHAFWNEHERHIGTSLYGRRMYETMRVWRATTG